MIEQVPVLLVAIPIVGGALVVLASLLPGRTGWPLATLTALVQLSAAGWLVAAVAGGRRVTYVVGGFAPPRVGIQLVVDGLSAAVVGLVAAVYLGVLVYARRAGPHTNPFYALSLLLVAGLSGMVITGDVFNLYVFLEITGLAAYGLVASGDRDNAAVAALKYLIVGTVGASLYLLGVGYLLVATGTLNMADLAATLGDGVAYTATPVLAAFALIATGLAVKVALFPLHTWQPDAYGTAPDSVAALISALVSTVAAYALARVSFAVFEVGRAGGFYDVVPAARTVVLLVAATSVVAGAALAVTQRDVRRMLAYSSVSQFGLVIAGFTVATSTAVVGAVVHLVGHAVMKGGLFAAAGIVERRTGATTVEEYAGLADRAPVAAGAFAVLAFAMVGVPPAVGFVGKWYLVVGAVDAGAWSIVAVLLVSTLLTLAYFARLVEAMYFSSPATAPETSDDRPDAGGTPPAGDEAGSHDRPTGVESEGTAGATVADGGDRPVSVGMLAVVVAAALLAVGLGLVAPGVAAALERTLPVLQP